MSSTTLLSLITREVALLKELDEIREQKIALISASKAKAAPAAAAPAPVTPVKAKTTAAPVAPPAPMKAPLVIKKKAAAAAVATADTASESSVTSAATMNIDEHWRAYKAGKRTQFKAADASMSNTRLQTAVRRTYTLEHPAQAAALTALEKERDEEKRSNPPKLNSWLAYVQKVREEAGIMLTPAGSPLIRRNPKTGNEDYQYIMTYKDAVIEASRRREASDPDAPPKVEKPLGKRALAAALAASVYESAGEE
jgi:hypothetical protein